MKKCDYCAKQIEYNEQYCCYECEKSANNFYKKEKRSEKIVAVINLVTILGIIISGFIAIASFARTACLVCASSFITLGITYFVFPCAPENIIKQYKLKKSIKIIKIIASAFLVLAAILLLIGYTIF